MLDEENVTHNLLAVAGLYSDDVEVVLQFSRAVWNLVLTESRTAETKRPPSEYHWVFDRHELISAINIPRDILEPLIARLQELKLCWTFVPRHGTVDCIGVRFTVV